MCSPVTSTGAVFARAPDAFRKAFAERFANLESMLDSPGDSPLPVASNCQPCQSKPDAEAGASTKWGVAKIMNYGLIFLLSFSIVVVIVYIVKQLKKRRVFGSSQPLSLQQDSFGFPYKTIDTSDDVIPSDDIAIVVYHSDMCGHCKNFMPHFEDAAKRYLKDKMTFKKCSGDLLQQAISSGKADLLKEHIMGFPTTIVFRKGQVQDKIVGNVGASGLEELIKKFAQQ